MSRKIRVLRLCSVKSAAVAQSENWVNCIARTGYSKTLWSLFAIYSRLPKLTFNGTITLNGRRIFTSTDAVSSIPFWRSKGFELNCRAGEGLEPLMSAGTDLNRFQPATVSWKEGEAAVPNTL